MTGRRPTSRWRRSAVSYGPAGRLLTTALVLLPVWWLLGANIRALALRYQIGFFFAACAWTAFVVPALLHDIWKRVPYGGPPPPPIVVPPEPAAPAPGESISDRPSPSRW
jgi:hypothetical protein